MIKEGRVSSSIYARANVLRIIKFPTRSQTNCETHKLYTRWWYTGGLDLVNYSLDYKVTSVVYYPLQL